MKINDIILKLKGIMWKTSATLFILLLSTLSNDIRSFFGAYIHYQLLIKLLFPLLVSTAILYFLALIIQHKQSKNNTKAAKFSKFSLMWDNNHIPYCQKCDSPLSDYVYAPDNKYFAAPYFKCHKCGHKNIIKDKKLKHPSLEEVIANLKK